MKENDYNNINVFLSLLFKDIWCCLVIGCFDWKIGVFEQTVKRVGLPQDNNVDVFCFGF